MTQSGGAMESFAPGGSSEQVLVTGSAGFIGFHAARYLLARGVSVMGVDSVNDYYDPSLKRARLAELERHSGFQFEQGNLADNEFTTRIFELANPKFVIHLAAQPGVRYSLRNPYAYVESNIVAFVNVLEACKRQGVQHLTYASSSSVYGTNKKVPYSVSDNVDHPVSLYAATKKSNELFAHTYSHLYGLPTTGLRFFTVYGPYGRPDMAYYSFTRAILSGTPIEVYNNGDLSRDFTYVDDIVEGIGRLYDRPPQASEAPAEDSPGPDRSAAPYRVYNIGNHTPVKLTTFIDTLEGVLGKKAVRKLMPMQPGDVYTTFADVDALVRDTGFSPSTPLEQGLQHFVSWYRGYHHA